jgi:hypothetical protein
MPKTVETLQNKKQLFDNIYVQLAKLQKLLADHRNANPIKKIGYDKEMFEALELMQQLVEKVDSSVLNTLIKDAKQIGYIAQKSPEYANKIGEVLLNVKSMLILAKKEEYYHIRAGHFLMNLDHRLQRQVEKIIRQTKSYGAKWKKHYKDVLAKTEVERRKAEVMGKKAEKEKQKAEKAKKEADKSRAK